MSINKNKIIIGLGIVVLVCIIYIGVIQFINYQEERDSQLIQETQYNTAISIFSIAYENGFVSWEINNQTLVLIPYRGGE